MQSKQLQIYFMKHIHNQRKRVSEQKKEAAKLFAARLAVESFVNLIECTEASFVVLF